MTGTAPQSEKKIAISPLQQQSRRITGREFNALRADQRLALILAAPGKRKYELILEAADAAELVPRLPAQEIYLLVRELGAEDVPELVALASTEQFTTLLDLDCWRGDLLDGRSALHWLGLLLDAGEEKVARTAREIEFELLQLMLSKWLKVVSGPEEIEDEDARIEAMSRNGGYVIEYVDDPTGKLVGRFLAILWSRDQELALLLMEGIRQECGGMLEEEVYQWRIGRLLDQGFPAPGEARAVFAWLDPETFRPEDFRRVGQGGSLEPEPPGFVLTEARPRRLLAGVLAEGISRESTWELTFLLNKMIQVEQIDVGAVDQVRKTLERLYAMLDLALEYCCGQDQQRAVELFETTYPEALFRLGYSLTLRLQRRARALLQARIATYLDGPFRAMIDALCLPRPEFFLGISEPQRSGHRLFATVAEIDATGAWLERLELQRRLFEERFPFPLPAPEEFDLSGCRPAEGEELSLSDLFLTALANRLLGREFLPTPIPADELLPLHRRVSRDGRLNPALREETRAWLETLEPGAGAFGDWCLERWDEGFCSLAPEHLDPRFVEGLIVRL